MSNHQSLNKFFIGTALTITLIAVGCAGGKLASHYKQHSSTSGQSVATDAAAEEDVAAVSSLTYEERVEIIKSHCTPPEKLFLTGWLVEYEKEGTRAPIEDIPGGQALEIAAATYAIHTLDFDVSLEDVVTAGFWPFELHESIDLSNKLYDFELQYAVAYGNDDFSSENSFKFGSDEWLIASKVHLLTTLYRDYYYHSGLTNPMPPLEMEAIPAFWYNSLEGRPMESSEIEGDICTTKLDMYWIPGDPRLDYDIDVLQVNFPVSHFSTDSTQHTSQTVSCKNTSDTDVCCLFHYVEGQPYVGSYEWEATCCCPCTPNKDWCCTFRWTVNGTSCKEYWEWERCVSCDLNPVPSGYCVRSYGMRAPDTIYAIVNGTTTVYDPVCDPTMACTNMDEDCENDRDNFYAVLNATSNSRVMTWPGPKCTQCGSNGSASASSISCCKPKNKS